MSEQWEYIKGSRGYAVSNQGRIKTYDRSIYGRAGHWHSHKGRILIPGYSNHGYQHISLINLAGKKRTQLIHRLVAETFIPNPNCYDQINHRNCDKSDNRVVNLEWCTAKQNVQHALANNLRPHGEDAPNSKLNRQKVLEIRKLYQEPFTQAELALMFDVSKSTIGKVVRNIAWRYI